jgi:hypothetical protein
MWNCSVMGPVIAPRVAKTMDVVTSEIQLATNSRPALDGALMELSSRRGGGTCEIDAV